MKKKTLRPKKNGFREAEFKALVATIGHRIHRKKRVGEDLDIVEAHLAKISKNLLVNNLAPSKFSIAKRIFRSTYPIIGAFSLSVVIAGFLVTQPLHIAEPGIIADTAEAVEPIAMLEEPVREKDYDDIVAELDLAKRLLRAQNISRKEAIQALTVKAQEPQNIDDEELEKLFMMKFLAGLIAHHRPNIQDCGHVAREIVLQSDLANVDPFFVASIISVESAFSHTARSHAGARGLMQLLPTTAKEVFKKTTGKGTQPELQNPKTNIALGIAYIKELERRYRGNKFYALAAYNWGPSNVDKSLRGSKRIPGSVKGYANKILDRSARWKSHYGRAEKSTTPLKEALQSSKTQKVG